MKNKKCSLPNARANQGRDEPIAWFGKMLENCLDYVRRAKAAGKHIVGITCEYTPRELIIAADGVAVCLCGGSAETVPSAERDLPVNLCPLIKSTYGYHVTKTNPFLEMADLVVAETTCDGKKKMYELMALSRDIFVLELPQKPDQPGTLAYWTGQLRKLKSELERRFDVTITSEKIRKAIRAMNRERDLRRKLACLMAADNPPITGRQLLDFRTIISPVEEVHKQYESILKLLNAKSPKNSTDEKIRVLLTGVPVVRGAERVVDLIENTGGLIVCMDNCTGLKPVLEDVDCKGGDPIEALARKYLRLPCSVMTKNDLRLDSLDQMVGQYRPDCIIELIWQNCLTYEVESFFIKRFADETGLPYLKIETDYSPSDSARIKLRIEALFETIQLISRKQKGESLCSWRE